MVCTEFTDRMASSKAVNCHLRHGHPYGRPNLNNHRGDAIGEDGSKHKRRAVDLRPDDKTNDNCKQTGTDLMLTRETNAKNVKGGGLKPKSGWNGYSRRNA